MVDLSIAMLVHQRVVGWWNAHFCWTLRHRATMGGAWNASLHVLPPALATSGSGPPVLPAVEIVVKLMANIRNIEISQKMDGLSWFIIENHYPKMDGLSWFIIENHWKSTPKMMISYDFGVPWRSRNPKTFPQSSKRWCDKTRNHLRYTLPFLVNVWAMILKLDLPVEIVDLPNYNMLDLSSSLRNSLPEGNHTIKWPLNFPWKVVIFHGYVIVCQRVLTRFLTETITEARVNPGLVAVRPEESPQLEGLTYLIYVW